MAGQRFYADPEHSRTWDNGAIGYGAGGPFDCLGPYAKVTNCPIHGTNLRRTAYATGYADTFFSVPARCQINGQTIRGYFTWTDRLSDGPQGIEFRVLDSYKHLLPAANAETIAGAISS